MSDQIFLSPQVKSCANITYKRGIYDSPQELQQRKIYDLRKLANIIEVSNLHRMIA